jgi:hypothetical protein
VVVPEISENDLSAMVQTLERSGGYALAGFTVELRAKGWHYWPTYGDKADINGPYSSMASVTLMIARELKRELTKRDAVHVLPE